MNIPSKIASRVSWGAYYCKDLSKLPNNSVGISDCGQALPEHREGHGYLDICDI